MDHCPLELHRQHRHPRQHRHWWISLTVSWCYELNMVLFLLFSVFSSYGRSLFIYCLCEAPLIIVPVNGSPGGPLTSGVGTSLVWFSWNQRLNSNVQILLSNKKPNVDAGFSCRINGMVEFGPARPELGTFLEVLVVG